MMQHICDQTDERGTFTLMLKYDPMFAPEWDSFRLEAECMGPQSWRRFVPGLYWISKRYGPRPTKEWKRFVDKTIQALNELDIMEHHMLYCKISGLKKSSWIPQLRELADW